MLILVIVLASLVLVLVLVLVGLVLVLVLVLSCPVLVNITVEHQRTLPVEEQSSVSLFQLTF